MACTDAVSDTVSWADNWEVLVTHGITSRHGYKTTVDRLAEHKQTVDTDTPKNELRCAMPGLAVSDRQPYETVDGHSRLRPDAPLSGLVFLDVDHPVPVDQAEELPHVAAWCRSVSGGLHLWMWAPHLRDRPAGDGSYGQAWTTAAAIMEACGVEADAGRKDPGGVQYIAHGPLIVHPDPTPLPPPLPDQEADRPYEDIDQALADNPALWAKVGQLAGTPSLRAGVQPCPLPGHTHTARTNLSVGGARPLIQHWSQHGNTGLTAAQYVHWARTGQPRGNLTSIRLELRQTLGLDTECGHRDIRQYGDRAIRCTTCDLLIDLRTWQTRDLNGTGPVILDWLDRRYPQIQLPDIDVRLASDPLPDGDTMLDPDAQGPAIAADPLAPTVLHGPTGVGKTSIMVSMLAHRPTLRAVWCAGEGIDWAHQRLQQWHPQPDNVLVVRQPYPIQEEQYTDLIRSHEPQVVVVDPYAGWVTAWQLAENDAGTPTMLRDIVHRIAGELPVLIAAAERKPTEGTRGLDRIRGSSGLSALAALAYRITTSHQGESFAAESKRRTGARSDISWALDLDTGLLTERTGLDHQDAEMLAALVQAVGDNRGQPVSRTRWGKAAGLPYIHQTVADRMLDSGRILLVDGVYGGKPGYLPAD